MISESMLKAMRIGWPNSDIVSWQLYDTIVSVEDNGTNFEQTFFKEIVGTTNNFYVNNVKDYRYTNNIYSCHMPPSQRFLVEKMSIFVPSWCYVRLTIGCCTYYERLVMATSFVSVDLVPLMIERGQNYLIRLYYDKHHNQEATVMLDGYLQRPYA